MPDFEIRKVERNGEEIVRAFPPIPKDGDGVWAVFWALSRHRVERRPISPSVVLDWCKLHRAIIPPLAATVLDRMDASYLVALESEIAINRERAKSR